MSLSDLFSSEATRISGLALVLAAVAGATGCGATMGQRVVHDVVNKSVYGVKKEAAREVIGATKAATREATKEITGTGKGRTYPQAEPRPRKLDIE